MEALTYTLLSLAIFFESFLLVTFLSRPARVRRQPTLHKSTPHVAIIVPCWNEASTIRGTIESLLALDYPREKLSIIAVDDGSTDGTRETMHAYDGHPVVTTLYHDRNQGKHAAMNTGIAYAKEAELIGFLDADSFAAPDALKEIAAAFDDSEIAAVTASMSIHQPATVLQRIQYAEYSFAIILRHILGSINALYVTPGPFSFYRRSVFDAIGLFKHAYLAEDMEMALRMQRAGLKIGNALRARVYTKGPATFPTLVKQRTRWTTGFLRNVLYDYRDLLGTGKNPVLGLMVLPLGFVAIIAGIFFFIYNIVVLLQAALHAITLAHVVPLSYTWESFSFSLALPMTSVALMTFVIIFCTASWMSVGKAISNTPGWLAPNFVLYILLYGLVAPFWLIRSVTEVARGADMTWR